MSLALVSVLVLWALVASRVPAMLTRAYDSVFWVAFTAAIADTVNYPPVYITVDNATGNMNLASLISGSMIMLSFGLFRSAIIRAVVTKEDQPKALHRGMLQTSIAMTVFVVAFFCALLLGDTSSLGAPVDAVTDAGNRSDVGVYIFMVTMCTFLLLVSVEIIRTCWKYVPAMTSRMFRAGFGSVALGCAFAVIALTAKIARQTIVLLGMDTPWDTFLQDAWVLNQNTTAICIAFGLFLPAVSGPVARFQVLERYRLALLHRLWLRAAAATPTLVNSGRPPLGSVLARRPSHRLHRAVVEILDSQMAVGSVIRTPRERRLVERAERTLNA